MTKNHQSAKSSRIQPNAEIATPFATGTTSPSTRYASRRRSGFWPMIRCIVSLPCTSATPSIVNPTAATAVAYFR